MTKPIIKIHNCETDEVIEREMNQEEYDMYLVNCEASDKYVADLEVKAAARASALAKLAALGLSADEIAAL